MPPSQSLPLHHSPVPGVDFLLLPEARFKTCQVQVHFECPLDDQTPARSLLTAVLEQGTAGHPGRAALARRQEELFGAGVGLDSCRVAEINEVVLSATWVGERFLPESMEIHRQVMDLAFSLLTDPLRGSQGEPFVAETVERERTQILRQLEARRDNRAGWAYYRFLSRMCAGEAYSRFTLGEADEVQALTAADLETARRRLLEGSRVRLVAVGPFDPGPLQDHLAAQFAGQLGCSESNRAEIAPPVPRQPGAWREFRETMPVDQARQLIGFRFSPPSTGPALEAMVLANGILGGGIHGRLFQVIREQRSQAYGISSSPDLVKGILVVSAGIDAANHEQVRDEVLHQAGEIAAGRFNADELAMAREAAISSLRSVGDSAGSMARFHLREHRLGFERTLEQRGAELAAVTKEEIAAAAASWRPDCAYLLHGETPPVDECAAVEVQA